MIQRFEDRCTEANAEIQQLKGELQNLGKQRETAEGRLASTLDARNKLKKQLEGQHSAMMSLQAEAEVWKVWFLLTMLCALCLYTLKHARGALKAEGRHRRERVAQTRNTHLYMLVLLLTSARNCSHSCATPSCTCTAKPPGEQWHHIWLVIQTDAASYPDY